MLTEGKADIWVLNSRFHWHEMWARRTCVSAVSADTKPTVSQPRSHLLCLRKSLAVTRNPQRHIFNLSLRYRRALTHSTWIMCTSICLPLSPSLASVRITRVSPATSQLIHQLIQPNAPHRANVCLSAARHLFDSKERHQHVSKAASFWQIFTTAIVCVRAGSFHCEPQPSGLVPH